MLQQLWDNEYTDYELQYIFICKGMVTIMRLHARLSKVISKMHFIRWGMTSVGFTNNCSYV